MEPEEETILECINIDHCYNSCLCEYRNSFLKIKPEYKRICYEDLSYKAQVILRFIKIYDLTPIRQQDKNELDIKNIPDFLFKENSLQEYGMIYPNFAFLFGSRRTNYEFTYFIFHCNESLLYNTLAGLSLFTFLFYLKQFKKCLALLQIGYIYTKFDQIVFLQLLKEINKSKLPSVLKKIKRKLK